MGALSYVAVLVTALATAWRLSDGQRHMRALAVSLLVAMIITNMVSNAFVHRASISWYAWGIIGLCVGMGATQPKREHGHG